MAMAHEINMFAVVQKEQLGLDKCIEEIKFRMSRYNITPNMRAQLAVLTQLHSPVPIPLLTCTCLSLWQSSFRRSSASTCRSRRR